MFVHVRNAQGVLHGARTYLMQDEDGQTIDSHSISAGLDYPAVGPEHAFLNDTGRAVYEPVTDTECMDAFLRLTRTEGITPAIESAHALAGALRLARRWADEGLVGPDTPEGEETDADGCGVETQQPEDEVQTMHHPLYYIDHTTGTIIVDRQGHQRVYWGDFVWNADMVLDDIRYLMEESA